MPSYLADRRLYLTADRERVVEHGDPDAAFLLCGEGRAIPPDAVERYGLEQDGDGKIVVPGGPEVKMESAPENKMAPAPEDKDAEPSEEKEIEVEQSGSWYTIKVDGEEVDKVQGEAALEEALEGLE